MFEQLEIAGRYSIFSKNAQLLETKDLLTLMSFCAFWLVNVLPY